MKSDVFDKSTCDDPFRWLRHKTTSFCKNKSKHVRMCSLQFNFYPVSLLICRQNVSGASSYPNRAFKRHTKMLTKCKTLRIKMDFIE